MAAMDYTGGKGPRGPRSSGPGDSPSRPGQDQDPYDRPRQVSISREVIIGGPDHADEPDEPIELHEEADEADGRGGPPAPDPGPAADDAGPQDDIPVLVEPGPPPAAEPTDRPRTLPPPAAPKRPSDHPPGQAFRAAPIPGAVIPVPPPFVPFPDMRASSPSAVYGRGSTRPAVSPPPPDVPPEPVEAPPPPPPSAPEPFRGSHRQSAAPARPSPAPVRTGGSLPRVIISEEAYRPSSPPPPEPARVPTPPPAGPPEPALPAAVRPSPPPAAAPAPAPVSPAAWLEPSPLDAIAGDDDDISVPPPVETDESGLPPYEPEDVSTEPPACGEAGEKEGETADIEGGLAAAGLGTFEGDDAQGFYEESAALAIAEDTPPPADERSAYDRDDALGMDSVPSVISIPEDDIPRALVVRQLPTVEVVPAESSAGRSPPVERVQELAEEDLQTVETELTLLPVVVDAPSGERISALKVRSAADQPAAPRRKRRRHGARKPWWEEIFDEEHIRSLPKYTPEDTRREVDLIQKALGVERGGSILDLACGHGRHAVEFAARGYNVVGLDLSLPMLARAGEAAQERGVKINFIQGDMRELQFEAAFDAVYCVGTSFGYFDDDTNSRVVKNIWRALKAKGLYLIECCNRDHILREQPRSNWFQGEDRQYLEETDFNYITSRLVVKRSWALPGGEQEAVEYSMRLYSLHELGMMLHSNGFKVTEVSGHYATPGIFFGGDSARLIILSEKR